MAASRTYDVDEMVLLPVEDEEAEDFDEVDEEKLETKKELLTASKSKTKALAAAAEKEVADLLGLLGKLKTGTATQAEKEKVRSLNSRLDERKHEIEASKTLETATELKILKTETKVKTRDLARTMRMKEIASVVKAVGAAEEVDLAFIIDCTGSMGGYISEVKNKVNEIIAGIRKTNASLRMRLAVVGYRDLCDGDARFQVLDFTSSTKEFKSFVGGLTATGGGDGPEDIAGAIKEANNLYWQNLSRVAFLIADAPCHGSSFNDGGDSYPAGTPGIDIFRELKILQNNRGNGTMTIKFGRITNYTDKMIREFQASGIKVESVDIMDASKLTKCVTASVRKSIFKTTLATAAGGKTVEFAPISDPRALLSSSRGASSSGSGSVSLKSYRILPSELDHHEWKSKTAVSVKVFQNRRVKSMDQLQKPLQIGMLSWLRAGTSSKKTDKTNETKMFMRRAPEPFAEGEIRIAYHGQLARQKRDLDDPEKSAVVLKSFKHHGIGVNDRRQYLKQMEISNIAHFLAKKYNDSEDRPHHCARIKVLRNCVVEEDDDSKEAHGTRRFCVEDPLPEDASFVKFSNNTGHWDEDHLDETLLRFTQFTYKATDGYLMVTDLQGAKQDGAFILTDPVILCTDILRFGSTNLGEKFMKKCIDSTRVYLKENGWN